MEAQNSSDWTWKDTLFLVGLVVIVTLAIFGGYSLVEKQVMQEKGYVSDGVILRENEYGDQKLWIVGDFVKKEPSGLSCEDLAYQLTDKTPELEIGSSSFLFGNNETFVYTIPNGETRSITSMYCDGVVKVGFHFTDVTSVVPVSVAQSFDLVLVEAQNLEYISTNVIMPPSPFSETVYAEVPWEYTLLTKDTRDTSECPDWTETRTTTVRFAGEGIVEAEHLADGIHIFSQTYGDLGTVPEGSIWTIESGHEAIRYLNCQNRFYFYWRYQP